MVPTGTVACNTMSAGTNTCKLRDESRNLRAQLSIRLPSTHACPLTDIPPSVSEIERASQGGKCHLIVKPDEQRDADDAQYLKTPIEEYCPCTTFAAHDTVATVIDKTGNRVIVELYPPDRLTLMDIIQELTSVGDVEINTLALVTDDNLTEHATVNVAQLTQRERKTAERAVEKGYYRKPRGISIDELAEHFDVSKSNISQRLAAVERKVILDAME